MTIVKQSILFLLLIFLFGCSGDPKPEPEIPMEKMNINFPKQYKILDYKYDWAIGDASYNYKLLISKKDYKNIVSQIENKKYFVVLDTSQYPVPGRDNNTDMRKINEFAYSRGKRYFYNIFLPMPPEDIILKLENDSIMEISYNDL